jgi:hypothetical protein
MITPNDVFEVTLGVSSWGVVGALAFKLLRTMTRHSILLTGQSLGESRLNVAGEESYPHRFRYFLRIQSLEATRTEYPMEVTIPGFPNGPVRPSTEDHVWAVAGWKAIDVIQDIGYVRDESAPVSRAREISEGFIWRGIFRELPAFDAWCFDVVMPCDRVDIAVRFLGAEASKVLTPTLGPYFDPEHLTVFATDQGESRLKGPVTLPRPVVPLILSGLSVGIYILVRTLSWWRIQLGILDALDAELMVAEVLLIWLGYSLIRRPVYPVISGYRFITPPWPRHYEPAKGPEPPFGDL